MKENVKNFIKNHKAPLIGALAMIIVALATLTTVFAIRSIRQEMNDAESASAGQTGTVTDAAGTETDARGTDTDASLAADTNEMTDGDKDETSSEDEADEENSGLSADGAAEQGSRSGNNGTTKTSADNKTADEDNTYTGTEITDEVLLQYAYDVIDIINAERESQGLQPFEINDDLMTAASIRVNEYVTNYQEVEAYVKKYGFGHPRPDGRDCDTVMEDLGYTNLAYCIDIYNCDEDTSGKYIFSYNENLARGYASAAETVAAWMSDSHRYLILDEGTSLYSPIEVNVSYNEKWLDASYESGSLTGTDAIGAAVAYVNGVFYWSVSTATLPHEHDFSGEIKSMMDIETYRDAIYIYDDLDNWASGQLIYVSSDIPGYTDDVGLNRAQYIEYLWKEVSYYTCKYCGAIKWVYRN